MNILVDVNLPVGWIPVLKSHGFDAVHWTSGGDPRAPDPEIMRWARDHDHVVFTHDLDFGAILALTRQTGPSVLQIRTHDITPTAIESTVVSILRQTHLSLERGALVSADETTARVRVLPIK